MAVMVHPSVLSYTPSPSSSPAKKEALYVLPPDVPEPPGMLGVVDLLLHAPHLLPGEIAKVAE